jgi:hypothetical protein
LTLKNKLRARKEKGQKLRKHRDLLVESLRTHLLPVFTQQGFALAPRVHRVANDRKTAGIFPFESLRRARTDGGVDLVEIQLMTYGGAVFRINACAVPKEGLMTVGGHRNPDELEAGGLHDHFEMYACPRLLIWFSLRFWSLRPPVESHYEKLALRVARFVPELELALREGRLGPHMRRIVFPFKLRDGGSSVTRPSSRDNQTAG